MPVNKSVPGLQNLVTSANEKFRSSQRARTELIRAVTGESEFSTANNLEADKEERHEGNPPRDDVNDANLEEIIKDISPLDLCLFIRTKHTDS